MEFWREAHVVVLLVEGSKRVTRNIVIINIRPFAVKNFHFPCLGTEIFLRELTLSNTLSSNPKSSRSIDVQFSHKLQFYLHLRLVSTQENYPWIGTDKKVFRCLVSPGLELMTVTQRKIFLSVPIHR